MCAKPVGEADASHIAFRSAEQRDREFADSPLEGDGFEPSVPGAREPVILRKVNCAGIDGQPKNLAGYRWFESISLQRGVHCETGFCRQSLLSGGPCVFARLPPIEDRLGDIRRQIAEADEPHEIGALPLPLGKCSKRDAFAIGECRVEPARPEQQRDNHGSVPSIPILIFLAWRGEAVTAWTESRFRHFMHALACSRQRTVDLTNVSR